MKKAILALIGQQPLPNLIPIFHHQPDRVILVYTNTNPQIVKVYERLDKMLRKDYEILSIQVSPSNIVEIEEILYQEFTKDEYKDFRVIFNLTGGTKPMSLAAYNISRKLDFQFIYLESEKGRSLEYIYNWIDNSVSMLSDSPVNIPVNITLDNFLDAYLGKMQWKEEGYTRSDGSIFEKAIADYLGLLVDEVKVGVRIMLGQIDIDLIFRNGDQFGIIEAKSGKNGNNLDGVKQLNNTIRHLSTFTKQYLVITVDKNNTHSAITESARIQVISLKSFAENNSLSEEDKQLLKSAIGI